MYGAKIPEQTPSIKYLAGGEGGGGGINMKYIILY